MQADMMYSIRKIDRDTEYRVELTDAKRHVIRFEWNRYPKFPMTTEGVASWIQYYRRAFWYGYNTSRCARHGCRYMPVPVKVQVIRQADDKVMATWRKEDAEPRADIWVAWAVKHIEDLPGKWA